MLLMAILLLMLGTMVSTVALVKGYRQTGAEVPYGTAAFLVTMILGGVFFL